MTNRRDEPREEALDDVLEDEFDHEFDDAEDFGVPLEADPADTAEQHQPVGGDDEDDYR